MSMAVTAKWKSTTTGARTPCGPFRWGARTGCISGSQESGPLVATLTSGIASAQRAEPSVRDYLADVFEHLCDPEMYQTQKGKRRFL